MASGELGVFTTDAALVVTSWDDWLAAATGIALDTAIGRPVAELLPEVERRGLLRRFESALADGTVEVLAPALHHYLVACPPRLPSDRFDRMQQRVTIGPLREQEQIVGVLVTIEDVTARLEAERALSSPDWRAREAAVAMLASDADSDFVQALVATLRHEHRDFNLLSSALKLLGSTTVEVTGVLTELLRSADADLRIQAALALGTRHDPAAIPALRAALADPEINVRFQAIESLGRLGAEAALDDLLAIADGPDYFLAFAALDAVAALNDPRVLPRLVPLLESEAVRAPAAEAIGRLGDASAVGPLVEALNRSSRGVVSIALALVAIQERLAREFDDGNQIAETVRRQASGEAHDALIRAVPAASGPDLRALVRVLGWLDGEPIQQALTGLLGEASVRSDVIEALVRQGERAVDQLIEQLRADDRDVRHAAIVALGRVGSPRAAPALIAMLDQENDLLVAIAGALARIGDKSAFEPLLGLLGHADGGVRQSAIGALNSIGHPELPARIRDRLSDRSPLIRESAVRIAGYFGYAETVSDLLARADDEDEAVRRAALEHLPFVDDERVLPALVHAVATETPRARAAAARALGRMDDPSAGRTLVTALGDSDPWVRYFAVRSLVERRDQVSTEVLGGLAENDPVTHVRIAAIEALGAFAARDAVPLLKRLARQPNDEVAPAALVALGRIDDPEGMQALKEAIRADAPARRSAAVQGLIENGDDEAVQWLEWAGAADVDPAVAGAAIAGLGAIAGGSRPGAGRAVDALLAFLSDRATREHARRAIGHLPVTRIPELSRGLQHPLPEVRSATVDVLGRFRCEEATHAVSTALDDPAPDVRETAIVTLARLGARGLEPALARLSAHDPSNAVRRAAATALTGLGF